MVLELAPKNKAEASSNRNTSGFDATEAEANQEQATRSQLIETSITSTLREAHPMLGGGHGNVDALSFHLLDTPGHPPPALEGVEPGRGNLSEDGYKRFISEMTSAANAHTPEERDAATGRAAAVVATETRAPHGLAKMADHMENKIHGIEHKAETEGKYEELKHAGKVQVAFATAMLAEKVGMDPITSAAVSSSLGRALEDKGISVIVNNAVDGIGNYITSTRAAASSIGARGMMEANLTKAMNWMTEHHITPEVMKNELSSQKYIGKLQVIAELATHPEAFQRVATILNSSDSVMTSVSKLESDSKLRTALGDLAVSGGETIGIANRGLGSIAVAAGSLLRGDSVEEFGREMFRAGLAIAGGAAGGVAMGGVTLGAGALVGGALGSAAGSALADKMLAEYDAVMGNKPAHGPHQASSEQLKQDLHTVAASGNAAMTPALAAKAHGLENKAEHFHNSAQGHALEQQAKASADRIGHIEQSATVQHLEKGAALKEHQVAKEIRTTLENPSVALKEAKGLEDKTATALTPQLAKFKSMAQRLAKSAAGQQIGQDLKTFEGLDSVKRLESGVHEGTSKLRGTLANPESLVQAEKGAVHLGEKAVTAAKENLPAKDMGREMAREMEHRRG